MRKRDARVVITGAGCISPLGLDCASTWGAMVAGHDGIKPMEGFGDESAITLKAPIPVASVSGFDPAAYFDRKTLRTLDRVSQFALAAANEAIEQAGLDVAQDPARAARTAVIIGTANGGEITRDLGFRDLYRDGKPQLDPLTILRIMPSAPTSHISIQHRITGPSFVVSSACASSNHAFAQALQLLRSGAVDVAIAGGAEASLSPGFIKAWEAMRILSPDTCRPFSVNRSGLVLGEGAAMFVLETLEHAQARDARILCELAGAGMSSDASDMVLPDVHGASAAMARAMADAELAPEDVDYINAHGTGTKANDPMEVSAIRHVFGAHAERLSISSTKSMHGHLIGAAGALELIAAVGAVRHDTVPPTIHLEEPDPDCAMDLTPHLATRRTVRSALSNSFAFGGTNAVVAVKKWEGA